MTDWKMYAKALVGGLVAAIAFATPVVDDGVLASEWLGIAGAFLAGLGVVYATPNRSHEDAEAGDESSATTEGGDE